MKNLLFMAVFLSFSVVSNLNAANLEIKGLQADIYTKNNGLKKIELDVEVISRDETLNRSAIYDALNVVVGSFYAEDLMTSMGKENFKNTFVKYVSKKHNIELEEVYIIALKFVNEIDIERIIKAIKERDLCSVPRAYERATPQKQPKEDFDINQNVGDFGENL